MTTSTPTDEKHWIIQRATSLGNFQNLEHFIKTGKRGGRVDVIWEICKGYNTSGALSGGKIHLMTLEEACEWVKNVRTGKTKRKHTSHFLDDKRLYNIKTGEFIPCTALIV